jgi:hypothetical protein
MKKIILSPALEEKFKEAFLKEHSKFIHGSWLIKSDLGKSVTIEGCEWTVVGLWNMGNRKQVLLKSVDSYALEESKAVAQAMGYSNMRNLITGEEHSWNLEEKKGKLILIEKEEEEDMPNVWEKVDAEDDDEEEELDPIEQAIREYSKESAGNEDDENV